MRKLCVLIAVLALTGCTTNGQIDYGKTALVAVGVLVVGAALASDSNSNASGSNCHWVVTPDGSTQVCR